MPTVSKTKATTHSLNSSLKEYTTYLFLSASSTRDSRRPVIIEGSCSEGKGSLGWDSGDLFTQQTLAGVQVWAPERVTEVRRGRNPHLELHPRGLARDGVQQFLNKRLLNQLSLVTNAQVRFPLQGSDDTSNSKQENKKVSNFNVHNNSPWGSCERADAV